MSIPTLLARYPYFEEAATVVEREADSFEDLVSDPVLERAEERVTLAVETSRVGSIAGTTRVELFSYPVARAVVSAVDKHALTRRYVWAESMTALERFREDVKRGGESFGSVGSARVDFDELVEEFGIDLRETDGGYAVELDDYLELASGMSDERWKLVNRAVDDGEVEVSRDDVLELARVAVKDRVSDNLPLELDDGTVELVESAVEGVKETLADTELTTDIEVVEESEFPPCMKALIADVREGEHLDHHSRFAITTFLSNIGMSVDEIVETYEVNPGFEEEMTRYQTEHIQGGGGIEYTTPSCSTMVTYGDCRNRDELCETINHPLGYYRKRLEAMDDDEDGDGDDQE